MDISRVINDLSTISEVKEKSRELVKRSVSERPVLGSEFKTLLDQKVTLSQHAQSRIRSRELRLDSELQAKIARGMDSAQSKGSREALILVDDMAVIANIKSRTIITAMNKGDLKERIFTNIDSTVLV